MSALFDDQVPLLRPWLGDEEIAAVAEVIRGGWISQGPKVEEFETRIAQWIGVEHAVAVNAATSALHLSLEVSGVKPGDKVICPAFTCMATANAIEMAGAVPLFADIDARTYNLDPAAVESVLEPGVSAILLVHQIGLAGDIDAFRALCDKHGLILVEDAATAFGGSYKGRRLGAHGSPTCYSFHPRKIITTGEGGMLVTPDADMAARARRLRATGASSSDLERHRAMGSMVQKYYECGYNYRLTDMQAALGIVQFGKVEPILTQRAEQAAWYDKALAAFPEIETPFVPEDRTHAWSSYMIRLRDGAGVKRDDLLQAMAKRRISCRIGIQPLQFEPYYADRFGALDLPETLRAAQSTLFLPIFPGMREDELRQVISALEDSLVECRR